MGFEQVKAAGMYLNGSSGTLPFESLPFHAEMMTYSANFSVTDSAAAATAMVSGIMDNTELFAIAIKSSEPDSTCETDFDGDGDLDGTDLYMIVNGDENLDLLDEFATDFGRVDCP